MALVDRQRFDVRMPKQLADQLDRLSDATGFSRCEIFRRAIALYKEAKNVEKTTVKSSQIRQWRNHSGDRSVSNIEKRYHHRVDQTF